MEDAQFEKLTRIARPGAGPVRGKTAAIVHLTWAIPSLSLMILAVAIEAANTLELIIWGVMAASCLPALWVLYADRRRNHAFAAWRRELYRREREATRAP